LKLTATMAERANSNQGSGAGRSSGEARGGIGRGRGYSNNYTKTQTKNIGLCKDLESNIFDYGNKTSADLMRTMQEKIVQYVGAKFGGDIANELQNRITVVIPMPIYPPTAQMRHTATVSMVHAQQQNLLNSKTTKMTMLQSMIRSNPNDVDLPISLAEVKNEVAQLQYELNNDIEVQLTEQEKNEYRLEGQTYTDQFKKLKTHQ